MRRILPRGLLIVALIAGAGYGQSLADVARQNQANKDKSAPTVKKVYTTDDLSPSPDVDPAAGSDASGKSAEVWKRQILAQKGWVAYIQGQFDRLNASAPRGFSDPQAAKVQEQLVKEKDKLQRIQEAARQAGMPSSVYDPSRPVRFMHSDGARRYMNSLNSGH
jgi:hypothetical protein